MACAYSGSIGERRVTPKNLEFAADTTMSPLPLRCWLFLLIFLVALPVAAQSTWKLVDRLAEESRAATL